jgi:hypothetical protein
MTIESINRSQNRPQNLYSDNKIIFFKSEGYYGQEKTENTGYSDLWILIKPIFNSPFKIDEI